MAQRRVVHPFATVLAQPSCWPNHVWAYDFVEDRTRDGRKFRMLTVIDEYTRECLAIEVARHLRSDDVLHRLTELFVERGVVCRARAARPYPLRQRQRVHRHHGG